MLAAVGTNETPAAGLPPETMPTVAPRLLTDLLDKAVVHHGA